MFAALHVGSHKGRVEAESSPPTSYAPHRKKGFQELSILAASLFWLQFSHFIKVKLQVPQLVIPTLKHKLFTTLSQASVVVNLQGKGKLCRVYSRQSGEKSGSRKIVNVFLEEQWIVDCLFKHHVRRMNLKIYSSLFLRCRAPHRWSIENNLELLLGGSLRINWQVAMSVLSTELKQECL